MKLRTLDELICKDDPGWPIVLDWISDAKNKIEILPCSEPLRSDALLDTQVTTRSPMGAIIYESGGLLIDHGWLRILGSGHPRLPRSLPDWTRTATGFGPCEAAPFVLIADDVLGGFYALDAGALGEPGKIFYLAPDTLQWENTEKGYSDFLYGFCFNGDLEDYYTPYRWTGWQEEVATLGGDEALSIAPPLCIQELNGITRSIAERSRRPVPVAEAFSFALYLGEQLASLPDGTVVELTVEHGDS